MNVLQNIRFIVFLTMLLGVSCALVTTDFSAFEVVTLFLICTLLLGKIFINDTKELLGEKFFLPLVGFVAVLMLSVLFIVGDTTFFTLVTLYGVCLFILGRLLVKLNLTDTFIEGYRIGAVLMATLGLVTWYGPETAWFYNTFVQGDRLMLLFSDPNILGAFLVPALLFELATLIRAHKENRSIVPSLVLLVVLVFALYFTGSRGAFMSGCLTCFLLLILAWKLEYIQLKRVGVLVVMIFVCLAGIFVVSEKGELFELRYTASVAPRLSTYMWALEAIGERDLREFLRGSGGGSFETMSPKGVSAHNTYLRVLFEHGFLGLAALFLFVAMVLYTFWKARRYDVMQLALFTAVIGVLIHGLVIDTLHMRHFWLLLGLL